MSAFGGSTVVKVVCFGSCLSCGCDPAGAEAGTVCNQTTGMCSCKRYVTGTSCDQCVSGFQNLEASNPLGCSGCEDCSMLLSLLLLLLLLSLLLLSSLSLLLLLLLL